MIDKSFSGKNIFAEHDSSTSGQNENPLEKTQRGFLFIDFYKCYPTVTNRFREYF